MGFGGGGTGSFSLPDHLHTNALLAGGSLEELVTLVDGATMAAWFAGKEKFELLDEHVAAGTESTYTFTPAAPLTSDLFSEIRVYYEMDSSAALALEMKLNGHTDYDWSKAFIRGAGVSGLTGLGTTEYELISATSVNGAQEFAGIARILQMDMAGGKMYIESYFSQARDCEVGGGSDETTDILGIDTIETRTSTSTWAIGSKITTYGVKK